MPSRRVSLSSMLAVGALASCAPVDPQLPLVGRARISAVYDVEVRPPHAFVLERGVLHVLDISDPAAPRTISTLEFERPRVRAALRFPFLYLTRFGQPLAVVDVSDAARPRWVAEYPDLTGTLNDVFEIDGDRAYLVRRQDQNDEAGRLVLDVLDLASDPARPHRLAAVADPLVQPAHRAAAEPQTIMRH